MQNFLLKIFSCNCHCNQVLIVDDASTDNTAKVALEYTKQHKDVIRVLKLGENHGKGGAVKLGVEKARGNYILMVSK